MACCCHTFRCGLPGSPGRLALSFSVSQPEGRGRICTSGGRTKALRQRRASYFLLLDTCRSNRFVVQRVKSSTEREQSGRLSPGSLTPPPCQRWPGDALLRKVRRKAPYTSGRFAFVHRRFTRGRVGWCVSSRDLPVTSR